MEHQEQQRVVGLGANVTSIAGLEQAAEHRSGPAAIRRRHEELVHGTGIEPVIDQAVADKMAIGLDAVAMAEAAPHEGVADDLALHLKPVPLPQRGEGLGGCALDVDGRRRRRGVRKIEHAPDCMDSVRHCARTARIRSAASAPSVPRARASGTVRSASVRYSAAISGLNASSAST